MSDSANETPVEEQLSGLQINPDAEEDDEELSRAVVNRLVALKQIHADVDEVNLKYKEERAALEKKYELLRNPILEKRRDVVSGVVDVEFEGTDTAPTSDDQEQKEVGIPGFWYQCIANHPAIGSMVAEDDLGALEALTDITCEYKDDYSGFKLIFSFRENDFFTNTELCKSYSVSPDLLEEKAPSLTSVDGTKIDWKHKKNLCMTEVKKKQKAKSGRKAGQIRFVTKMEAKQSFFHFFSDPRLDEDEDDEDDDDEAHNKVGEHEFQLTVDEDYEAGHAFRAEIIPDAILWFTGEALDDMDDEDYDEEGDDSVENDDEDDDDDDDEDGPASSSVPAGGAGEQPECKQS